MRLSKRVRRRLLVLFAGSLVVVTGVVTVKFVRTAQLERLIAESRELGANAYERGEYEAALNHFSYYIQHRKHDPEAVEIMLQFADARSRLPRSDNKQIFEARAHYEAARRLIMSTPALPNRAALKRETLDGLLDSYEQLGMLPEVIDTAGEILEEDPDETRALSARATAYYFGRDFDESLADIERLIALEPDDTRWRQRKLELMSAMKRPTDAILATCRAWSEEYQGDGRMLLLQAAWEAELGINRVARDTAMQAAVRGADSVDVLQELVSLLDLLGLAQEADGALRRAESEFPHEQWVQKAIVRRHWLAGEWQEAMTRLDEVQSEFAELSLENRRLRALVHIALHQHEQAIDDLASLESLAEKSNDDRTVRWVRAMRAHITSAADMRPDEFETMSLAVQNDGNDPVLLYILGDAFLRRGEQAQAVNAFQRAVALEPSWIVAQAALAESLLLAGRPNEAYQVSRVLLLRRQDAGLAVYLTLARAYIDATRIGVRTEPTGVTSLSLSDLIDLLQQVCDQLPENADAPALLAEAYALNDNEQDAQRVMIEAIAERAPKPATLLTLARVSARYGLGYAEQLIARAHERNPSDLAAALAQAHRLAEQGRGGDGLAIIDASIKSSGSGKNPAVRLARTKYLFAIDDAYAMSELRSILDDAPAHLPALSYALLRPEVWGDQTLVNAVLARLTNAIGAESPQVRLAEANAQLHFAGDDDAKRAAAMTRIADVLEESPRSVPALELMARAHAGSDPPARDQAIIYLKRAVDAAPTRGDLLVDLITLLHETADFETAETYLRRLTPLAEADTTLAWAEVDLLQKQGDFETALQRASRLLEDSASVRHRLLIAELSARAGRKDAARAIFEELCEQDEDQRSVIPRAAEFFANDGDFERGFEILQRLAGEMSPAEHLREVGAFCLRHHRFEQARDWLTRAVETSPDSAEAHFDLARFHLQMNEFELAQRVAKDGLAIDASHSGLRSLFAAAGLEHVGRDRHAAIQTLRSTTGNDPAMRDILNLLERISARNEQAGITADDLDAARALVERHPGSFPAWRIAVLTHERAGDLRNAIGLARQAVARFPSNSEPCEWATRLLIRTGRSSEALTEAQEWRRRTADQPLHVDVVLASILLDLGRPLDAAARLDSYAARLRSERQIAPERLETYVESLVRAQRVGDAWGIVEPLFDEDERWLPMWLKAARIVNHIAATDMLERLETQSRPFDAGDWLAIAGAWSALGSRSGQPSCYTRAEELAHRAADFDELRTEWLFTTAHAADLAGDDARAEQLYRELLEIDPEHIAALNNIAIVLARMPNRAHDGLSFIDRSLKLAPNVADLHDTRARVLIAMNRNTEARQAINTALELRPSDVAFELTRIRVLQATGWDNEARVALDDVERRILRLDPPNAVLTRELHELERWAGRPQSAQAEPEGRMSP